MLLVVGGRGLLAVVELLIALILHQVTGLVLLMMLLLLQMLWLLLLLLLLLFLLLLLLLLVLNTFRISLLKEGTC